MRFKLRTFVAAIILSLCLMPSAWAALEINRGPIYGVLKKALPFEKLELAGYLKNATALRLSHGLEEFMKVNNIVQLEAEYKLNDQLQFFSIFKWFYDAVYDIESKYKKNDIWESKTNAKLVHPDKQQWLRELYLDYLTDQLDMRIGKQQVVWGNADGVRILDLINPLDYREWTLPDYIDSRIPLWMFNAEGKLLMNGHLQFLAIPDYQPNYYAPAGAPFTLRTVQIGADGIKALTESRVTVSTIDEQPRKDLEHMKYGLRWRQVVEGYGLEYTLNYLNTYDFASSAYTVMDYLGRRPIRFELTRRAEKIQVFGGSFNKTITEGLFNVPGLAKGLTLRGELAYITGGAMNYGTDKTIATPGGTVDTDQLNYMLGFDKTFFTKWQFSLQFIQMWALNTEKYDTAQYTLLNGATRGPLDRLENTITLMVATDFMHQRLKPQVLVIYGDDNDWRISPKVSYEINDQWMVTAGLHIFEGKEQNLNGQFDKNDEVFVETKYTF